MADGGSGWAVNERTNEGTGCGEAWPNDFACYTWIVIFSFSFFYFCALPWGWTSAFFIAVVMPLSTGRKFSFFFYSHPLVDLRDRIFNLRQFFIFFSLWGVNNSICLNLNYSCSHPRMFHPQEKTILLAVKHVSEWFFSPWKNQTKISSWPICGIGNSKTMTDLIRRAYDTQSFSCWLPDSTFSPPQSWLCWTTFRRTAETQKQKNWSKVNQPKVYFF
jgi:hypothetical protein